MDLHKSSDALAGLSVANRRAKSCRGSAMRIASMLCVTLWLALPPAWGQETTPAEDLAKGHQLAATVCAVCHVAAPDQRSLPILNPPAPAFASIAQRKEVDKAWLENFLTTTHRGLDRPDGMPSPYLLDYQVKQVTAYLLSLRK